MKRIYDELKALVGPELISKAAAVLDEKESNISSATSSIMASLLGVMLKKGNTQQIENILNEAGHLDILSNLPNICEERPTHDQQRIGDDFLQHLLGDKAADFTTPVAKNAGISEVAGNRLVSILAPVFAGFLGRKLVKDNFTMAHLMNEIESQKSSFSGFIPAELIKSFNLSKTLQTGTTATTAASAASTTSTTTTKPEKKKNNGWIIWLILIILLLLLFWGWRSCRNKKTDRVVERTEVTTITTPNNNTTDSKTTVLTLPNGTKLTVNKNGTEEAMIKYLESNEYKNASDADLMKKWFTFDNINFEFNSSTNLMSGSQAQIDNIAAILKAFPNAKVLIAGFADKVGSDNANMQISRARAKTIESMLERAGDGKQVVKIEGRGDEYAKHSASESDAARAEDRDIALRFVK